MTRRSLKLSVLDGMFHAVMVGVSESYFGALAVELGHQDTALALLTTVPLLVGALSQPLAGALAARLGGRKRLVLGGAIVQALSHVAFFAIATTRTSALWPLLLTKIVFWVAVLIIGPAWSAWMAVLTRDINRERYFAWRSALCHVALLVAFTAAGLTLGKRAGSGTTLDILAVLHLVGLVARLGSAWAISAQSEPEKPSPAVALQQARLRLAHAAKNARWRVAVYFALVMFGTQICAPFFTPFMLRELQFDYVEFSAILAVSILAKTVAFPIFYPAAERFGLRAILAVSGIGVSIVPVLWAQITDFHALIVVQVLSGVVWAGIEFSSFQLLLGSAEEEHRMEFLSLANCVSGVLQVAGALVGSALITKASFDYESVFLASGAVRVVALVLLSHTITDVMVSSPLPRLFFRIVSVRPGEGAVRRPVLPVEPSLAHSSVSSSGQARSGASVR